MACYRINCLEDYVQGELQYQFGEWGIRLYCELDGVESCLFLKFDIEELKNVIRMLEEQE